MIEYLIHLECPKGHKQTIRYQGERREIVEDYASMLDGSNAMFVSDPRPDKNSAIGRCMACADGTKFVARVTGEEVN